MQARCQSYRANDTHTCRLSEIVLSVNDTRKHISGYRHASAFRCVSMSSSFCVVSTAQTNISHGRVRVHELEGSVTPPGTHPCASVRECTCEHSPRTGTLAGARNKRPKNMLVTLAQCKVTAALASLQSKTNITHTRAHARTHARRQRSRIL